jgi:hypothetical protein
MLTTTPAGVWQFYFMPVFVFLQSPEIGLNDITKYLLILDSSQHVLVNSQMGYHNLPGYTHFYMKNKL